jgi:hypothetical protein
MTELIFLDPRPNPHPLRDDRDYAVEVLFEDWRGVQLHLAFLGRYHDQWMIDDGREWGIAWPEGSMEPDFEDFRSREAAIARLLQVVALVTNQQRRTQ